MMLYINRVTYRGVHILLSIFLLFIISFPSYGKIYYSKNEAMQLVFGKNAEVEMLSLFLTTKEKVQIEKLARLKLESSLFTFYVGKRNGQLLGYAAIENYTVRTKPEVLLILLSTKGLVTEIHTLAFHEPPEYQPPLRWYQQFFNHRLDKIGLNTEIQGITGATLSTRSAIRMIRKVMAVFKIAIQEK